MTRKDLTSPINHLLKILEWNYLGKQLDNYIGFVEKLS